LIERFGIAIPTIGDAGSVPEIFLFAEVKKVPSVGLTEVSNELVPEPKLGQGRFIHGATLLKARRFK
jgi:hypothetical protein